MQFVRNLKHIFAIWSITLIALFGVVGFGSSSFIVDITHRLIYRETGLMGSLYKYHFTPSTKDIAIVKIDDASINALQAKGNLKMLTIPKSAYIDLIEKLESVGVKGIAFDIIFQNKDPDEERFAETMKNYKNVVIASTTQICIPYNTPKKVLEDLKIKYPDFRIESYCDINYYGSILETKYLEGELKFNFAKCFDDEDGKYKTCDGIPRSVYNDVSWGLADMDVLGDRKIPFYTILSGSLFSQDKHIPSLGIALYNSGRVDLSTNKEVIYQPFFGPPEVYPKYSFADLLTASKIDLVKSFAGKYIFVGESSNTIQDRHISPVTGSMMDGVEFHAHMLDGLLQNRIIVPLDATQGSYIIAILFLSLISIVAYLFLPKFISPIVALIALVFLVFLSRYLYFNSGIVIEIFPVLLAGGIFSFPATFIYRFFIIDREKRALTSAFSHYVDPTLVREIADKSTEINLGGESRELTILFSDIAGFTTLSEKLSPSDLFYLMSSYLSQMTDILIAQGGTLDKYIGDAVMGFFGAPLPEADHARRACDTALLMRQALPGFNTELVSRGLDPIDFRIGIASGEVLVGNIGSHDRFNYTVLGDTVNLASRLEATSKEYGTHTIIAEPTYLLLEGAYFCRALDRVAVKGKQEGVLIYELIAKNDDIKISREKYIRYEEALRLYFEGKYLEAGQLFEANMTDDVPSKIMAFRCVEILRGTITVEGGVYRMTHK